MNKKISIGGSLACIILALPIFNQIKVVNLVAFFSKIGVNKEMAKNLFTGYHLFNLLSFVQNANQGALGIFAMVLFLLAVATLYFNIAFIIRVILKRNGNKGELGLIAAGKLGFFFELITELATIAFTIFANKKFKITGFVPSVAVYIAIAVSLAGYVYFKVIEKIERESTKNTDF